MTPLSLQLAGAEVLRADGLSEQSVALDGGKIVSEADAPVVDLSGYRIFPGIVDAHGDAFERHVAPRRGAMKTIAGGIRAAEAEIAANGITTAVMAQFYSWEGGLRGPEFAAEFFSALKSVRAEIITDLRPQMRLETHLIDVFETLPEQLAEWGIGYVVFNDHLPHDRLAEGRKPPRMTGQALKAGLNPDVYFQKLLDLHALGPQVPPALQTLCEELRAQGITLGSHDDTDTATRAVWRERGAVISEFPETQEAAEAARAGGDSIILGAPNVVRGGSHKGKVSALDLIIMGLCDALVSDYHYPSLRAAVAFLVRSGVCDLATAWGLISDGPARMLGLNDRGRIEAGYRADLVILDKKQDRIAATISGGRVSYLSGEIANRFVAAR